MNSLQRITVLLMLLVLISEQNLHAQNIYPSSYEKKVVIVPEGQSRTFMFTNQMGLFYYGETSMPNTSQYHGLSYLTHKFLEDYIIELGSNELSRSKAEAHLMGDKLIRFFKNLSVEEEVSMADSLPLLTIKIHSEQKIPMAITPLISSSNQKQDYILDWSTSDKILYIAQKNHLVRNDDSNYPVWIGICTYPEGEFTPGVESLSNSSQIIEQKIFYPGKINIYLENDVFIFFILGDSKKEVLRNRNQMLKSLNIEIKKQKSQIEGVRQA